MHILLVEFLSCFCKSHGLSIRSITPSNPEITQSKRLKLTLCRCACSPLYSRGVNHMMELAWGIGCGEKVILPYVPSDTLYECKKFVTQCKQIRRDVTIKKWAGWTVWTRRRHEWGECATSVFFPVRKLPWRRPLALLAIKEKLSITLSSNSYGEVSGMSSLVLMRYQAGEQTYFGEGCLLITFSERSRVGIASCSLA